MANEISVTISTTISQSGQSVSGTGSFTTSLSATNFIGQEVTVGSSSAATISILGLTDPSVVYIKNLDTTNFITVDAVVGLSAWPQKLLPGQAINLLPTGGTIYAKADTAPCQAWVVAG